ncbi:hypothetical protein SYNTR_1484 [Candidatus Syntrophocurvum alkaliphilum]|uniref:Uncharacterized protein n=1 Tax=Candidatus Syntrophocurvum alkaliphilum TaxID=2293317 RepID=A0A6I6DGE3_9FIRM|nr:hypothetical protein [Candidatus Syntrophocurvum alkaliphilum]QGU00078.1 hypothetical protein SYNTR_1484 [Candidatus Syntrophocurvum alkaliphilum]
MFKAKGLTIFLVLVLVFNLTIVGCGQPENNYNEDPTEYGDVKDPENGDTPQSEGELSDPDTENYTQPEDDIAMTGSGEFGGWIDNNSVEIGINAFQVTDETRLMIEEAGIDIGDEVVYNYVPSDLGQPILIKIERL